ncbi:MAG: hemolysin III family protein [Propionibacteriales bacterium]|nr:hemolysin III family protein [Propionibacteriales bacterium]
MTGSERIHAARDAVHDAVDESGERFHDAVDHLKPKLRGWLHAGILPVAIAAGIVLVALSPNATSRVGSAIFATSAVLLFGVSAVMHRTDLPRKVDDMLRRFDHSNIFLLIAGTYTPFTLLLLDGTKERILLTLVWTGALAGIAFRVFWLQAPRWIYTPVYLALGWAAIFWMPDFAREASIAVLVLMIVGGALYSVGGLVYGFKRPDPAPRWFGFHEVFHTLTIIAFITHYVGISIATYSLR